VQETYTRAFQAWSSGRPPRKVEPWLATICLNTGRSLLRRASTRREVSSEPDPTLASSSDVSGDAIANLRKDVTQLCGTSLRSNASRSRSWILMGSLQRKWRT
jgi:DNA-directed RNA polymerase specialized sigma24 family protein